MSESGPGFRPIAAETPPDVEASPATKLSFRFRFSAHLSAGDAAGLRGALDESDLYIPEGLGANAAALKRMRKIAQGNEHHYRDAQGQLSRARQEYQRLQFAGSEHWIGTIDYEREVVTQLYQSGVPVLYVDLPEDDPRFAELIQLAPTEPLDGQFDAFISAMGERVQTQARLQQSREHSILQELVPKVTDYVASHPQLRSLPNVTVLITYGASHTRLYTELKRTGHDATWEFPFKPYIFSPSDELQRRYMYGKEVSPSLLSKAAADMMLWPYIEQMIGTVTDSTDEKQWARRMVCESLSEDEVRELYEIMCMTSQVEAGTPQSLISFLEVKVFPVLQVWREQLP
ncbi:hypothetical protein HY374_01435 [Candidatus Berkelbacteria bacterium]|nr:hypothetical protein [Candidatus Berkelbacteria bacterium]